jgi:hypothetical protein
MTTLKAPLAREFFRPLLLERRFSAVLRKALSEANGHFTTSRPTSAVWSSVLEESAGPERTSIAARRPPDWTPSPTPSGGISRSPVTMPLRQAAADAINALCIVNRLRPIAIAYAHLDIRNV